MPKTYILKFMKISFLKLYILIKNGIEIYLRDMRITNNTEETYCVT